MSTAASPFRRLRQRVRQPSLRAHLIALMLLALVPVFVFCAWLVVVQARHERAAVEKGLQETTRALAVAVDREVDGCSHRCPRARAAVVAVMGGKSSA